MPETITNADGDEQIVYTQAELQAEAERVKAEYEAKLAEKDAHVKEKLDQFQKAKGTIDVEREEALKKANEAAENARQLAEKANADIQLAKELREKSVKEYWMKSMVGEDPELLKKMEENFGLINLELKSEDDIKRRVELAANLAGINKMNIPQTPFVGGGYAPDFKKTDNGEYENFLKEHGINIDQIAKS